MSSNHGMQMSAWVLHTTTSDALSGHSVLFAMLASPVYSEAIDVGHAKADARGRFSTMTAVRCMRCCNATSAAFLYLADPLTVSPLLPIMSLSARLTQLIVSVSDYPPQRDHCVVGIARYLWQGARSLCGDAALTTDRDASIFAITFVRTLSL